MNTNENNNRKLGVYSSKKVIGNGSSGCVYLATDQSGKTCAVKLIPKKNERDAFSEIYALTKLSGCSNVINMNNFFLSFDKGRKGWLIELEFCCGGNLLSLVEKKRFLSEDDAMPIAFDVLTAIFHAHKNGICHRDIKLENVLLMDSNASCAVLADWGMSVEMKDSLLKRDCGSLHYASPEILSSKEYDGRQTDMWSVGILIFAMVTGCFPFVGDSAASKLSNIYKKDISLEMKKMNLSDDIRDLITKMIVVDPYERISAYDALQHPWFDPLFDPSFEEKKQ